MLREFPTDFHAVTVGGDVCDAVVLAHSGTTSRFTIFTPVSNSLDPKHALYAATSRTQVGNVNVQV